MLRPTLRDVHNHALATSDIFRPAQDTLTVFRPVVQPDCSVQVRLHFERLPDDRPPALLCLFGAQTFSLISPLKPQQADASLVLETGEDRLMA